MSTLKPAISGGSVFSFFKNRPVLYRTFQQLIADLDKRLMIMAIFSSVFPRFLLSVPIFFRSFAFKASYATFGRIDILCYLLAAEAVYHHQHTQADFPLV